MSESSEIQHRRFEKELNLISKLASINAVPRQTQFGVIVRVIYQPGILHTSQIEFDLYLEGKYPFQPPKLTCESVFSNHSVSDGRDLITEILKEKWTPSLTSVDIIGMLPVFFKTNLLKNQNEISGKDYGKFHLGSPYYLGSWDRKDSMGEFYCTEIDPKNPSFLKERMIVVTHTVILILELNPQYPEIGYLISWATLQSLNCIRRVAKENDKLTFDWKKIGDSPAYRQYFKVRKANSLVDLISRNMKKLGAVIKKHGDFRLFQEDEVNGKAVKMMNIQEILQAIEVYEDNFESSKSLIVINNLLELYQRAIEYFAAVNSNQYDIFLKRMRLVLSDEDAMNIIQGNSKALETESEFTVKSQKLEDYEEKRTIEIEEKKTIEIEEKKKIEITEKNLEIQVSFSEELVLSEDKIERL